MYSDGDVIRIKCSIEKAMDYYMRSPTADLFVAECKNCKIFIDGYLKNVAAYIGMYGHEFIIGTSDNFQFDEHAPTLGVDIYGGGLVISNQFKIARSE